MVGNYKLGYLNNMNNTLFQDLRRKVARVVGSKCSLAARVDSFHEQPNGNIGQSFRYVN